MTKVYVLRRRDSYRVDERVAVFTSKRKVYGYLLALMDSAKKVTVRDSHTDRFYYERDAVVTVKNLMDRMVILTTSWTWTYYVEEVEVR